ncbi:MAG: hypothetical protein QOG50_121, partial [Actinomycetota bacterium]|nr:hypothetical protein [Actinomycetota bacterium]
TLLDLRRFATVADAMAAVAAAVPVDYLPRFRFVDDVAVCVYPEDVAYADLADLETPGPRHRLYLRGENWEYIRD